MQSISKKVYITPSVFFAFIDRAHPKYQTAGAFFRYFALEQYALYSDAISISNTYSELYDKISPSLAKDFLRSIYIGSFNILHPEESDMKAALKTLVNYRTTDLTYPESVIAVLANRNRIPQICSFEYLHPLFGLSLFYLPI